MRIPLRSPRTSLGLAACVLLTVACRPGDAPEDPTEPSEPTVGVLYDASQAGGGRPVALTRRSQALARLN